MTAVEDHVAPAEAHDLSAEQSVLGGMLLSSQARDDVEHLLEGRDFYRPAHEQIYDAIIRLHRDGLPADPVTVADELAERGELARVGGPAYLHTLTAAVPAVANAGYYARIVAKRALLRRLDAAGTRITQLARAGAAVGGTEEILAAAEAEVTSVRGAGPQHGTTVRFGDLLDAAQDEWSTPVIPEDIGVLWGWVDLDKELNPLTPGQLVIVGARPRVGKSLFLGCLAEAAAVRQRRPVLWHSLEMSIGEVRDRLVSAATKIPLQHLQRHDLTDDEWHRFARQLDVLAEAPLWIDDTPRLTLTALRANVRRYKPAVVLLDYLQLADVGATGSDPGARRVGLEAFTRGLKLMAKQEGCAVVAAAQLNRGPEHRADKRPGMSDLRETGAAEQDADVVLLLHREDLYERESPRAGEVDVIIDKQRNGPSGEWVVLAAQTAIARFSNFAS